jgi:hypothetical protein
MAATELNTAVHTCKAGHEKLKKDLGRLLDDINNDLGRCGLESFSAAYEAMYKTTLKCGLESLIGTVSFANSQAWDDTMAYGREVIHAPEDTVRRAASPWIRSCTELHKELIKRFGPETINAARLGTISIIQSHYDGDARAIAHVNKKASYLRHRHESRVGAAFYPQSNPLSASCYQVATLPVSLALSSFLPVEKAVQAAHLSLLSLCDDYGTFTQVDYEVRLRMVALTADAAYQYSGKTINVFLDGLALQSLGQRTATPLSVEAAMAWRAVGGCATVCSRYSFEECDLEDSLVTPIVMMATHDLLDWRCDTAAGNYDNGVSAVYGCGIKAPFHTYLEALLRKALSSPRSGVYAFHS